MNAATITAIGGVLVALAALYKAWMDRRQAMSNAQVAKVDSVSRATQSAAELMEAALTGTHATLVMKDEELDDVRHRLTQAEEQIRDQLHRLEECERHSSMIDDLRKEVARLRDELQEAKDLANRYLRERNEARDDLRSVREQLHDAEERLDALEGRTR